MLHITNGSIVASQIRLHAPGSNVIEWGDVLHEGPTPEGLPFVEMNAVRATFLAGQGCGEYEPILETLNLRETLLAGNDRFTLWFEEDLFDQLQVLQILDCLSTREKIQISLVWIPQGAKAAELEAFHAARRTIRGELLAAGAAGWKAFCAPTPKPLLRFLKTGAAQLPHLSKALVRHLQEYPSKSNGLSRTERQILESLVKGPLTPLQVFAESQSREESVYMGDSTFWHYMQRLSPLLEGFVPGQKRTPVALNLTGREVLAGQRDWVRHAGIDRWLGGVHLQGQAVGWRWDDTTRSLAASTS